MSVRVVGVAHSIIDKLDEDEGWKSEMTSEVGVSESSEVSDDPTHYDVPSQDSEGTFFDVSEFFEPPEQRETIEHERWVDEVNRILGMSTARVRTATTLQPTTIPELDKMTHTQLLKSQQGKQMMLEARPHSQTFVDKSGSGNNNNNNSNSNSNNDNNNTTSNNKNNNSNNKNNNNNITNNNVANNNTNNVANTTNDNRTSGTTITPTPSPNPTAKRTHRKQGSLAVVLDRMSTTDASQRRSNRSMEGTGSDGMPTSVHAASFSVAAHNPLPVELTSPVRVPVPSSPHVSREEGSTVPMFANSPSMRKLNNAGVWLKQAINPNTADPAYVPTFKKHKAKREFNHVHLLQESQAHVGVWRSRQMESGL
jgi:hypothetical protein